MILAAGFGKRLRPLTDTTPKPLIPIGPSTCLDRAVHDLMAVGSQKIVINTHHLADQIHQHVHEYYPQVIISHEPDILETGGGILKASPYFGDEPFFVLNGDIWRQDEGAPALKRLETFFDLKEMDILLLVVPKEKAIGYTGRGDYFLGEDDRLVYRGDNAHAPYVHSGAYMMRASLFNVPFVIPVEKAFSVMTIFHQVEKEKRLFGLVHQGSWGDIGTPEGLADVRKTRSLKESLPT